MMSKHTAGTWIVEHARINQGGAKLPYVMAMASSCCIGRIAGGGDGEAEANAHLIAAAPDMLHALERFVAGIEAHADDAMKKTLSYHLSNMNAAIAKAKGE